MSNVNDAFTKLLIKAKAYEPTQANLASSSKRSVADQLFDLTLESKCEIFIDEYFDTHIVLPENPTVAYPLKNSQYRRWLAARFWDVEKKGFSSETFKQVINSIEGYSFRKNQKKQLYNRVAKVNDVVYYDLCLDKPSDESKVTENKVVKIDTNGWEITTDCPVKFKRFSHQLSQSIPERGGNYRDLLQFVNLTKNQDQLLFLTHPIITLLPNIPRAALMFIGDKGSGKSTALRIQRELIDPSVVPLLNLIRDIKEIILNANKHYSLFYDNLSYMPDGLSDLFSALVTGSGLEKRKLYTDDESIIFNQKVALGFSAIPLVATKPDLLERLLILQFEHISEDKRETEEKFWAKFNSLKPKILGAMFDHLSATLRTLPSLKLPTLPRLADYATYGCAASSTLGNSPESYLLAFNENVKRQNQSAIDASPIAQVIISFMQDKNEPWQGSTSSLYSLLKPIAEASQLEIGGRDGFPKSSNKLWGAIKQVRGNLISVGITPTHRRSSSFAIITLSKTSNNTVSEDQQDAEREDMQAVQAVQEEASTRYIMEDFSEPLQNEQSETQGGDNA